MPRWYQLISCKILEFLFVSQCFSCFCFSTSRRLSVVALSCVFHQGILQGFQPLPAWRWPNSRMAPSNWSWLELYTLHFAKVEVSNISCINIILYIIYWFIYLLTYLFILFIYLVYLFIYLFILFIYVFIKSIHLYIYLFIYLFTSLRDGNRPHRIVTANDVGHWDQKHPKVLIVGKKNAKNLIAMYSGPTQFKNNEKHEKTAKLLLFTVFLRGEKQKPLQIPWFLRVRWPKTL